MPDISIVVPVYNAGKYLEETMTCIVEQTMRDIEIICINDASTDDSLHILEQFADKDARISIFSNSSNQGAALSRNMGLNKAQSTYICFLDADDIYAKDMIEKAYDAICRYDADMAVVHSAHFKENPQEWNAWEFPWKEQCVSMENNTTGKNLICAWEVAPWNKMYKKEFIEKYHLSYQNLQSSEDVFFGVMAVLLAKKIVLVGSSEPLVLYRTGRKTQLSAQGVPMQAYLAFEKIHDAMVKWNIWEKYFESFFSFFYYGMIGQHNRCKDEDANRRTYDMIAQKGLQRLGFFEISSNRFENKKLYSDLLNYLICSYDSAWFRVRRELVAKVLYISHDSFLYGAPKSLLEFVIRIKDKGVEPVVILPDKGDLHSELAKNGVRNKIIPYCNCTYTDRYSCIKHIKYIWTNLRAVLQIRKLIKEEQINIVHTNTLAVNVGAMAALISKVPHIWHFREYMEEDFGYKRLHPIITEKLVKRSRCCIAVSEGVKRKYQKEYGVDSIRLYDGIESSAYLNPVNEDFGTENTMELLLAGAISERKGQWDAIRAVEILLSRGIAVHLNIVGNGASAFVGELKTYVRRSRLTKYITFRPFTHHLQDLRIQSSIVLVCSRMEAFGRVTAEAMMAGKIVVGTRAGGTMELIGANEERGYLYRYNHPEELADKIEHVMKNKQEVLEKEKKAQEFILKLTNIEKYTDRMVCIYKKKVK